MAKPKPAARSPLRGTAVIRTIKPPVTNWVALRLQGTDPRIATEIGRLHHRGELSQVEHDTAVRVGSIVRMFDRAVGAKRTPKCPSLEVGQGRVYSLMEDAEERDRSMRAAESFAALKAALRPYEASTRDALIGLCADDRPVPPAALPLIRRALCALAKPLGLARR